MRVDVQMKYSSTHADLSLRHRRGTLGTNVVISAAVIRAVVDGRLVWLGVIGCNMDHDKAATAKYMDIVGVEPCVS